MATVVLTANLLTNKGTDLTFVACNASDTYVFDNTGREFLIVQNSGGSSRNVTITRFAQYDGDSPTTRVIGVAAGKVATIGTFPMLTYNGVAGDQLGRVVFVGAHADLGFYVGKT